MKHALRLLHLALCLLLPASCDWRGDHYERLLAEAEEMNRHDSLFTSDSLGLALVRHYDHWWHSRNHRLRAYYMLGCAYRDMGEAPAALHYYHIATEQADTAKADSATYATLFRVYGQMAMIYGQQNMPEDLIQSLEKIHYYALLAKDTINSILAVERMVIPYYLLEDTVNVLQTTEMACNFYKKYGYDRQAAGVYPTAIYVSLLNGNYDRARRYMDIFESGSGLFDEDGNIIAGREHYYNSRGLYYLGVGKLDSAEYWFRKLASYGHVLDAYKGLLSVYKQWKNNDSILKYVSLTERSLGEWAGRQQADAIIQSSAMYRYERNQNVAMANAQDARRFKYICLLLFISAIWIYGYYRRRIREREVQMRPIDKAYTLARKEYGQLVKEYQILKREYEKMESSENLMVLIEQKQEKIAQLDDEIRIYQKELGAMTYSQRKKLLKGNDIVEYFIRKKTVTAKWKAPAIDKWMVLSDVYSQYMPFAAAAMDRAELSRQERLTTILTHLEFSTGDIAILLETGNSRISAVKKNASKKLFNKDDSGILKKRLVDMESGGFITFFQHFDP